MSPGHSDPQSLLPASGTYTFQPFFPGFLPFYRLFSRKSTSHSPFAWEHTPQPQMCTPHTRTLCCSPTEHGKSRSSVRLQICLPTPTRALRTFVEQVSGECLSPGWSDDYGQCGGLSWHLTISCRNVELKGTAFPRWEHYIV